MIKQFLKDSLVYAAASLLSRGLSFLLVPFYSRFLSKQDFGLLDIGMSVVVIANVLIAMEISQGMARSYSDEKSATERASYFMSSMTYLVASYLVVGTILWIFKSQFSKLIFGSDLHIYLLEICYACSFATALQIQISNHYRWSLLAKKAALYSVLQTLLTLTFTVVCVNLFKMAALGAILGMTFSLFVLISVEAFDLRSNFSGLVSWRKIRKMLSFSLPLVPSGVALFVTQFANRFIVNDLMGADKVAEFAVAARISALVGLVMMGVGSSLMPLVSENADHCDTPFKIANIFHKIVGLSLIAVAVLTCFSDSWIALFSTSDYVNAAPLLGILSLSTILSQLYPFAPGFWLKKKVWLMVVINVTMAVLGLILNYLLIPRFGLIGVAYASLASALCMMVMSIYLSHKLYPIPYVVFNLFGALITVTTLLVLHHVLLHSMSFTWRIQNFINGIIVLLSLASVIVWKLLPARELVVLWRSCVNKFAA